MRREITESRAAVHGGGRDLGEGRRDWASSFAVAAVLHPVAARMTSAPRELDRFGIACTCPGVTTCPDSNQAYSSSLAIGHRSGRGLGMWRKSARSLGLACLLLTLPAFHASALADVFCGAAGHEPCPKNECGALSALKSFFGLANDCNVKVDPCSPGLEVHGGKCVTPASPACRLCLRSPVP